MPTVDKVSAVLSELGLDRQNGATIGRLLAHGSLEHAEDGPDGRMRAKLRIPLDEMVWEPTVIVMPRGGDLDIEVTNDDQNTHAALFPSNGDSQWLWLPIYSRGTATLNLDGPGYYWFSSPIANDEGRGLEGAIVVLGDVPSQARLDRPEQPRP